jgi:hypothetical protein
MCMVKTIVGETTQVHGREWGRHDGVMMSLDSELDHNVVIVAHAHIIGLVSTCKYVTHGFGRSNWWQV